MHMTRIPMKQHKQTTAATRLTCAAVLLPGLVQTASAGRVEETYNADFQYGHYSEGKKRMEVDIFDGALSAPIGKDMTLSVGLVRDIVSGASPVYNSKDRQGKIRQIISGASPTSSCGESICEQRDAISANLAYFLDWGSISAGGGFSREHDYLSKYFNTNVSVDLNKKLTTLNVGASVAFDEIEPSPSGWAHTSATNAQLHEYKTSQNYLLGVTQIIDKDSLLQSNITFAYSRGYLTDPYKWVEVEVAAPGFSFSLPIEEVRPGDKFQWAWLNQYVRHFGDLNNAALHVDYRFSTDDWGVNAHTLETSWHQPIADGWQIIPRFRYYSQDQADFYQPVFSGALSDDFRHLKNYSAYSSDYRLAGFGALTGGIKLSKDFGKLPGIEQMKFQAGFEYYDRKAAFQLGGNGGDSFSDFNYYLVTASFNLKF